MRGPALSRRGLLFAGAALSLVPRAWAQEEGRHTLLVLTADEGERTKAIASTFKKGCDFAVRMSYLIGDEADAGAFIADNIRGQPLSLVFAVGPVALRVATREFAGVPVVFADVPPESAPPPSSTISGVPARLDAADLFARLAQLRPGLADVGILKGAEGGSEYWASVEAAAKAAGLRLTVKEVASADEVHNAFMALTGPTDLVWLPAEAHLWTAGSLARVFHEASIQRFPIVSFARAHADAPNAPAVVAFPAPEAVGDLAAAMARSRLVGEAGPEATGVRAQLVGHVRSMRAAGLVVSAKSTTALDELVGR